MRVTLSKFFFCYYPFSKFTMRLLIRRCWRLDLFIYLFFAVWLGCSLSFRYSPVFWKRNQLTLNCRPCFVCCLDNQTWFFLLLYVLGWKRTIYHSCQFILLTSIQAQFALCLDKISVVFYCRFVTLTFWSWCWNLYH